MGFFFHSLILFFFALSLSFASAAAASSSSSSSTSLRVLVPVKVGFDQFVSVKNTSNNATFDGFSVQVFLQALQRLKSPPPAYVFVPFGNGKETPKYEDMIKYVYEGGADAIVADLTITSDRMDSVDFTVPYIESALVMVTPFRYGSAGTLWDFLRPFSWELWLFLLASFVATGGVLYLMENKNPDFSTTINKRTPPTHVLQQEVDPSSTSSQPGAHVLQLEVDPSSTSQPAAAPPTSNPSDPSSLLHPGPPIFDEASHKRRIMNAYWFTSLCVFFAQQESVRTHLGRIVTVAWLFVMLIFNSSYTASLASFLSAQKSYPAIEGFENLLKSNVPVGYQEGSFIQGYLRRIGFPQKRLKSYASEQEYTQALRDGPKNGGIGAVLDELPYTQILLQSECDFSSVGDQIAYFGGFGFAFRKSSSTLTDDVSKGILSLAEDGTLQKLKNGWIGGDQCSSINEPSHLRLRSFGGLFSILGAVYLICIIWRLSTKFLQKGGCAHISNTLCAEGNTREFRLGSLSRLSNRVIDDEGSHKASHDDHSDPPNHENMV